MNTKAPWNNLLLPVAFGIIVLWILTPILGELFLLGTITPTAEQQAGLASLQTSVGWSALIAIGAWATMTWLRYDNAVKAEKRQSEQWWADAPARTERRRQALRNGDPNWWEVS